jgi:hypothetical protein
MGLQVEKQTLQLKAEKTRQKYSPEQVRAVQRVYVYHCTLVLKGSLMTLRNPRKVVQSRQNSPEKPPAVPQAAQQAETMGSIDDISDAILDSYFSRLGKLFRDDDVMQNITDCIDNHLRDTRDQTPGTGESAEG